MHQPYKKWGAVAIALLLVTLPLFSMTLDELLLEASKNSSQMRNLEINRSNVLLQQAATKIDDEVTVSVNSGTLRYGGSIKTDGWDILEQTTSLSGTSVDITLPNDGSTTFTLQGDPISMSQTGSGATPEWNYFENPSLKVEHTFTYGLTQDNLKDLNTRQTEILANSSYETTKLNFANTLYSQVSTLLNNEKTIKSTTKKLDESKKALADRLTLNQIKEGSLAYQAQEQAIRLSEGTLTSLQASRDLLLKQFESVTGVPFPEQIEEIREPVLSFDINVQTSSSLVGKQIDVQKAKESLALEIAQYTNKSLVVGGNLKYANSTTLKDGKQNKITLLGSAALGGKSFTVSGGVGGTYDFEDSTISPSVSVSGTWSNNPTSTKDALKIQQLENDVLLAEIAYNTAVDEYLQSAIDLQNSVASWQLEFALLQQTIQYNKDVLQQQEELFAMGLAPKKQVEDAAFTVELDEYDLKATLLKGLQLENQIKRLMI